MIGKTLIAVLCCYSLVQSFAKSISDIIFVLADDLGWAELGCYGNTFNETPYLDKMAKEGLRFTHAYAAAPSMLALSSSPSYGTTSRPSGHP